MWIWVLGFLTIALTWAVWWVLRPPPQQVPPVDIFPTWVALAITAGVVLLIVGVLVYRRVRAARAARALEKAIAQQAQEQALNAKPERRAEIQALHQQLQQGIEALKRSKLGGGKRGEEALYALPWYAIVGPPGAGKTTALRHSGLVFPFLDPEGGGVRGVGGTRNCDWWFTNEAILLDTAGRYTTQSEDRDEWIAFLEQLKQFRPEKPLNGVMVAISVPELLDSTEEQIEDMGRKIRARIDEMHSNLSMTLPVYVVFTKTDLVAGFVETFGDLKKSERGQAWGATLRLDSDKGKPSDIFEREFDLLVEQLHKRVYRRIGTERNVHAREKIYQFPLEFAALKQNLATFMGAAFTPSAGASPVPILRGFYFSSGTQEGTPLDRVVGAMGKAFGLKSAAVDDQPKIESRSYFLKDVFSEIAFKDQDVAARSEAEIARERMQRLLVAAAALALSVVVLVPGIVSFLNNRKLLRETEEISQRAGTVNWGGPGAAVEKVQKLDELRTHLAKLDQWKEDGVPLDHAWFMYQGDKVYDPALKQYITSLRSGFVLPVKERLEARLKAATGEKYLEDYNALKTYLLLNDVQHLQDESEWEAGRLTNAWGDFLRGEGETRDKLVPHVGFYVDLLKRKVVNGEELDKGLIERVRDILSRVGSSRRYYDQFVTVLIDQKYKENEPATRDNLKYPPVTLESLFADRPDVIRKVIQSAQKNDPSKNRFFEVAGPYTAKGYDQVMASLKEGYAQLDREKWVVPPSAEEKAQGEKIQKELDRVKQSYLDEYQRQWVEFFRDLVVQIPATNADAINEFKVLSTPDWPYQRLLRELADNTQFKEEKANAALEAATADGGVAEQIKKRVEQKIDSKAGGLRVGQLLPSGGSLKKKKEVNPVSQYFKSMVDFGVPVEQPAPKPANPEDPPPPPPPPQPTHLSKYVGLLEQLGAEMEIIEEGPTNADTKKATELFQNAVKETQGLLTKMDENGQKLMEPLLMNPLRQAYKALVKRAGGAASGLWEVVVWPSYRDKIKERYPFNLAATRDASFEDAVAFFKPKDGVLWGFYEQHLKDQHTRIDHEFFPVAHLENKKGAKPFTPYNANLYTCLRRAHEITDALFPASGGDKPHVSFQINLKTVSPIVSEVIFEIDGQKRLYRNEKPFFYEFKWPGEKMTGARIQVRGAGGLDEEILREGPWGIFRLFESAQSITAEKEKDELFTVTWQMSAPPVTVTMEVKPQRANHPFPLSFFRATNCPPSIGDSLGGKKG